MKFLKIFVIMLLLTSPLFAFSNELWLFTTSSAGGSGKLYVYNITSSQVIKTVELESGYASWTHFSNESNPILSVLTSDNKIRNFDDNFVPVSTFNLGFTGSGLIRVNGSFYYILEGANDRVREVSGSGAILNDHTYTGFGFVPLTRIFQYFKNGSNIYVTLGVTGATGQPVPTIFLFNLTDDTLWNISEVSGGGGVSTRASYLSYNLTTQEMVWLQIVTGTDDSWYAHTIFNSTTLFQQSNISTLNLPEESGVGIGYSAKTNALIVFNQNGTLLEYSDAGTRNRFIAHDLFSGSAIPVPEGFDITSGFVEQVGVSFDTFEFSAYCGINNPVPNISCSITDLTNVYSCQTSLINNGTIWINSTNYPVKTFFKVKNRTVPFAETLFNMTTRGGTGGWDATMWYVFGGGIGHGGIPSELNESWYSGAIVFDSPIDVGDIKDMVMWYDSTSEGFICSGGSSYRTEWYVGINSTHYLNRTSFCPNENYTVHDSYVQNTSLLINGSVVARTPLYTTSGDNSIRASVYEVTYWKANNPLWDVLLGSLTFVPPHLNISYEVSGRATCSVGDIPSGEYTYTCNLNSSYESLEGNSYVSGSITIEHGQNTTISIPMQRIIPLTLNITLYKGTSSNPIPSINTRCTNQKGSEFSEFCTYDGKSYGCCEFIGVDINTDYNTEISPSGVNVTVFNVTFPTSDYYNSDAVCSEWTGRCSRFTGNYRCLYNVESNLLLLNFSVKDCGSGQYIYGARVTYEDGKSCVTRQNGLCGFSEPVIKDFDVHNYTVSKRPYYEDKTFFFPHSPQVYPLLPCLERNASRNDINPEVAGGQEGDKDYSGVIGVMFDPMFVAVVFSFIIGGVVTFFSGSGSIGLVSIVGLFAMFTWFGFLPMWIGISIIIIGGLLAVNSVTNVFGSG